MSSYKRKRGPFGGGPSGVPLKRRRRAAPLKAARLGVAGELKFHDATLDDTVIDAAGSVTATVNDIPQGITEITRNGRKCTLRSFHWRYTIFLSPVDAQAVPGLPDVCRVILFQDKQCNGATAAVTDVLETANIHSFRNLANGGRFRILCDKLHTINFEGLASDGAGVVSQARKQMDYTFNKTLNVPIEFSSTTGAIGEIRSNNLGVLLISANGTGGFQSQLRIRFSDSSA